MKRMHRKDHWWNSWLLLAALRTFVCVWATTPALALCSGAQITVEELLTRVAERAREQNSQPPRREFIRTKTTLELDKKHNIKEREELKYRMVIVGGALYPRLVEKNGRPLDPQEKKQEEEKEARFGKDGGKRPEREEGNTVLLKLSEETAKRFDYTIVAREPVNGRMAYVIAVNPKAGLRAKTMAEQVMARISGRLWIDEVDYEIARLEVHLMRPVHIGLGILGAVNEFEFYLFRNRLQDGDWENSVVKIWVQFRVLLETSRIQYEEKISSLLP